MIPLEAREPVLWRDLGFLDYAAAMAVMADAVLERKAGNGPDCLLVVEHPPIVTTGRRTGPGDVVWPPSRLAAAGIALASTNRGGAATYHGPGQLVVYPILDLAGFAKDVRWYAQALLEVGRRTLSAVGVVAEVRLGSQAGLWTARARPAKIGSIGVRIERWVTSHGLALNAQPDLSHFKAIVACGLADAEVTSAARELGRPVPVADLKAPLRKAFAEVFGPA